MAAKYRVAVIGCGRPYQDPGRTGSGMARLHVQGYLQSGKCEIVALADIVEQNARLFAEEFGLSPTIYTDYKRMLRREKPDVVSICTWPHLHAEMVMASAKAGARAVHCEKPMAPTWGEARKMVAACEKSGTQLTFDHQRRFLEPFRRARQLIQDGALGELQRLEGSCSNMMDWGTHWLDMFFFLNGETPAKWVLGQIDASAPRAVFGLLHESQAVCEFVFTNGVRALLFTGEDSEIGCAIRAVGSEGAVELRNSSPALWVQAHGRGKLRPVKTKEGLHGGHAVHLAVADLLDALEAGREPELSAARALQSTEIIFATYESSRRRGRVDLPLKPKDSAFLTMLDEGALQPAKRRSRKRS